jgi:WD40 repeat protein
MNVSANQRYRAFLSHNGADKASVEALATELERRGISCWLDKWNLIPGEPWQPAIEHALSQCENCLVLFGPHGLGPWHNEEMRLALQRRTNPGESKFRVLPVVLPGGQRAKESDLPGFLQGTTWVEFSQSLDDEPALHRLECGIRGVPPGRGPKAKIAEGVCPYLGLKTFQPEDAPLFFGRTAKIQEFVDRLRQNFGTPKQERFLAMIGASGNGKSSLALAGLIPAIRRGELPDSGNWPLVRCRPGAQPWENLQIALSNNRQVAEHMAALPALITRPEDQQRRLHLIAQLTLHDQPETCQLFVLIDQFEEVFTLCNDQTARCQLIDNVLYATSIADSRTIVVLTIRADFYAHCANYAGLRAAIGDHQSLIGPLSTQELREAIEFPAQLAGGELEGGLMELLLADMKDQAGALPFLEHALFKLWERRDGRRLTAKAYMDTGRLQGALDAHAEEFFTKILTSEEQLLCRQILLDLVHPGEAAADTKKRVSLDDIAPTDAAHAVLEKLAGARLVTADKEGQAELVHEALIGGWRRLGGWLNENREQSRLKERLLEAAREWQKNSEKEDFLYRGAQLAAVEENFASNANLLPKLGREFLVASIVERQREHEERQLQQSRELENARKLAETQRHRALEKGKALRRQRFFIVALGVLLLIASLVAVIAAQQWISARATEKKALEAASRAGVSLARELKQAGDDAQALARLAQALRLNRGNYDAAALASALLTQTSWPLPLAGPMRHRGSVNSARFSPDGQRMVTASNDKTAQLWDPLNGEPIGEPMKHQREVNSAEFSPDGKLVVTASDDNTARLWDAHTGKPICQPMKHEKGVVSAQFSPDGRWVVTASYDNTARLWDAHTGEPICQPMKHEKGVVSAQFSPDGRWVVTASDDKTARLWDAHTGKPIGEPMKHKGFVNAARFSEDGQRVVTASYDNTARLWDAHTGKPIGEPMKHVESVYSAQLSPDGQRVLTASEDNTARLWDAATGKPIGKPMRHEKDVISAQFSPESERVLTASEDGSARLWDAATGNPIGEPMRHEAEVVSAQFSPDGQWVLTASRDYTAKLWRAAIGNPAREQIKHEDAVLSAELSPDGRQIVTASRDNTARLWDAATGHPIGEPMRHNGSVFSAYFSPDGKRVVTASSDNTARSWDAATGRPTGEPMKHDGSVYFAQFSPDGQRVLTASQDNTARLWDALTGRPVGEPMEHEDWVNSAYFSPDGQRVVTVSKDRTARLWDAATSKPIGQPMRHKRLVTAAYFSPDGQWVVTASKDRTAQIWDAATSEPIGQPMEHKGWVYSARFSPDSQRVVTASKDGTARIWDAATGKPIGQPMEHEGWVYSAQFSPDGQRIVTASRDRTARIWDAATGKPIGQPMEHENWVYSARFGPNGQKILTTSEGNTARLWDVPPTSSPENGRDLLLLADLAEATGDFAVQISGQTEILNVLTPGQVRATREHLAAKFAGPSSALTPLQQLLKWSVSEPRLRSLSPFSKRTVAEWVEDRIKEGSPNGLRAAIMVYPEDARLAAYFGRALAAFALEKGIDPDEARRARAEADFETRRAVKLANQNDEVNKLRAEVASLLQLRPE